MNCIFKLLTELGYRHTVMKMLWKCFMILWNGWLYLYASRNAFALQKLTKNLDFTKILLENYIFKKKIPENVLPVLRKAVLNILDRDSEAARIFQNVLASHNSSTLLQQHLIEHTARLLLKFDASDRFREILTTNERARLLEQLLSHPQTTVEFLDRLGATNTSMRVMCLFALILNFRQYGQNAAFVSLDPGELLNLVVSFDKTGITRPATSVANFLRYFTWKILLKKGTFVCKKLRNKVEEIIC